MSQRLHSAERLKSRKEIGRLFAAGAGTATAYPLRVVFRPVQRRRGHQVRQVAFVVPKRRFKRAVDRNLLKRRMREAYRLNRHILVGPRAPGNPDEQPGQLAVLFMYTGKEELPYAAIERKMVKLLQQLPPG